jgi:hypothetical protein
MFLIYDYRNTDYFQLLKSFFYHVISILYGTFIVSIFILYELKNYSVDEGP